MIEVPGLRPKSPLMVLDPVLVTVEPPKTAKLSAVPSIDAANPEEGEQRSAASATIAESVMYLYFISNPPFSYSESSLNIFVLYLCISIASFVLNMYLYVF